MANRQTGIGSVIRNRFPDHTMQGELVMTFLQRAKAMVAVEREARLDVEQGRSDHLKYSSQSRLFYAYAEAYDRARAWNNYLLKGG